MEQKDCKVGMRVVACWPGEAWQAGIVVEVRNGEARVSHDHAGTYWHLLRWLRPEDEAAEGQAPVPVFAVGQRVMTAKMNTGTVLDARGDGEYTVDFDRTPDRTSFSYGVFTMHADDLFPIPEYDVAKLVDDWKPPDALSLGEYAKADTKECAGLCAEGPSCDWLADWTASC